MRMSKNLWLGLAVMTFIGHKQTSNPADSQSYIARIIGYMAKSGCTGWAVLCANMAAC